jgi:hypothetical protein
MQHTDPMYNLILMPLVCFGGGSVMLAFVLLLPGVGTFLGAMWPILTLDWLFQKKKNGSGSAV